MKGHLVSDRLFCFCIFPCLFFFRISSSAINASFFSRTQNVASSSVTLNPSCLSIFSAPFFHSHPLRCAAFPASAFGAQRSFVGHAALGWLAYARAVAGLAAMGGLGFLQWLSRRVSRCARGDTASCRFCGNADAPSPAASGRLGDCPLARECASATTRLQVSNPIPIAWLKAR